MSVKKLERDVPVEGAYAETKRIGLPFTSVVTRVTRPHFEPVRDLVTLASAWSADSPGLRSIELRGMAMAVPCPLPCGWYQASQRTLYSLRACSLVYVAMEGLMLCSWMKTAETASFLCSVLTDCMHCWNLSVEARPLTLRAMYLGPGCVSIPSSSRGRIHVEFGSGIEAVMFAM